MAAGGVKSPWESTFERGRDILTSMTTPATIETVLRELDALPAPVHSWRVETGPDATEHSAVWVWITLEDEYLDSKTRGELRDLVRNVVREKADDAPWVYVRFRAASEAREP
jgi:hypothetical protein